MNKIKSITTLVIEENGSTTPAAYEERDQEGNITLLKNYTEKGGLDGMTLFEFDEKNRVIVEKQYSNGESPDQVIKVNYNESGKAHQIIVEYADGSTSYKNYSRDEAEKSTTIEIVDQDNELEGKEYRKFDSENRILEETIFTDTGAIETKAEYEYNDYGDIIESVKVDDEGFETVRFYDYYRDDQSRINKVEMLNEDENIIRVDEFEYDERGNRIKHIMKNLERGSLFVDIRAFDENDREIRFERLMGDRPIQVIESRYRADGILEEQETRMGDGVILNRFEYEFF